MLDLISSLVSTVTSLVNFLISTLTGLFELLRHIPTYVAFLTGSIGFLPSLLIPFATAYIALYAFRIILGKENN